MGVWKGNLNCEVKEEKGENGEGRAAFRSDSQPFPLSPDASYKLKK